MRRWLNRFVILMTVASTALVAGAMPAASDSGATTLVTVMNGAAERPGPGDADGHGIFAAVVRGNTLCYVLTAVRIEPAMMAHIHIAGPDLPGPIVVGLKAPNHVSTGCITTVPDEQDSMMTLTESELAAIVANPSGFYVNVHNAPFPGGAIRGQLR